MFNCFTYSALYPDQNQHHRTVEFADAAMAALSDLDVLVLPPLDLAPEHTHPEADWSHLEPNVYRGLAGYIWMRLFGGFS